MRSRAYAVLLGFAAACASAQTKLTEPSEPFSRLHYEPTTGRVGSRMIASLVNPDSSAKVPKSPNNGCRFHVGSVDVVGELPLGLIVGRFANIEGVPRVSGSWEVTVKAVNINCTEGPDQSVYPGSIFPVRFSIIR
jgi:hypothetical protein